MFYFPSKIFSLLLFLFLLLHTGFTSAQNNFKFVELTSENEMPTNLTKSIYEDSDGYVWIASDAGLICYNGKYFRTYQEEFESKFIKKIIMNSKGDLLVAADLGIYKVVKKDNAHKIEKIISGSSHRSDSTVFYPKSIFEDKKKNLWISEPDAVVKYSNGKLKRYSFPDNLRTESYSRSFLFIEDQFGRLLLGAEMGFLFYYDKNKDEFSLLYQHDKPDGRFDAITSTGAGDIWLGGNYGIYELKLSANLESVSAKKILNTQNISSFANDSVGNTFIGSWTKGLYYYSSENSTFEHVTELPFDVINDIQFTDDSKLWISSDVGCGLLKSVLFREQNLNSTGYYFESVIHTPNQSILATDGKNVFQISDNETQNKSKIIFNSTESLILSLAGDENNLFMGFRDGFIGNIKNGEIRKIDLPQTTTGNRLVRHLMLDKQGNL